jgi:hypothetical protein
VTAVVGARVRRPVLLFVVVATVVLGRSPDPAGACTCVEQSVDEQADAADVVVVGEVVDQEPSGRSDVLDAVRNRIAVERVYVGEAEAEVDVLAGVSASGSCEYGFSPGRYLVFAREEDDGLHTDWCSGNVALGAGGAAPAALGTGEPPRQLPPEPAAEEDDRFDLAPWPMRLVASGVGIAIGVGAGAALRRRRRSTGG